MVAAEAVTRPATAEEESRLVAQLEETLTATEAQLVAFRQLAVPRFFRQMPLPAWGLLSLVVGVAMAWTLGFTGAGWAAGFLVAALLFGAAFYICQLGWRQARPAAMALEQAVAGAVATYEAASQASVALPRGAARRSRKNFSRRGRR